MKRKTFLSTVSFIGLVIGSAALFSPETALEIKGVVASEAANVWVRQVGVLLISMGVTAFLVRGDEDSPTLKAFFVGNIILQLGLFPIEPIAYANGTITKLSGIVPNTMLHLLLAGGFALYLKKMNKHG